MSEIEKILIPLIDDDIKFKDVDIKDFIGVFTEDINSPGLDYIYLVFEYDISNLRFGLGHNGTDYVRRIGNGLFHIFKFPIKGQDIKKVLSGNYSTLSNEGIYKIYKFWNGIDEAMSNYLFKSTIAKQPYARTIPEETYVPLCKRKKPWGLAVEKTAASKANFFL